MIYVWLGIIQGLTEFLPVSSSGHLLLFERLLMPSIDPSIWMATNLALHAGTLLAVLICYRKRIFAILQALFGGLVAWIKGNETAKYLPELKLVLYLIVASVPAAVVGFCLKDLVDGWTADGKWLWLCFWITALLLFGSDRANGQKELTIKTALIVGIAQAVAVLPGISRSGSCLAVCLLLGIDRKKSIEFSFLLSIPVIAGGMIFELPEFFTAMTDYRILLGMVSAAVVGFIGVKAVEHLTKKSKNYYFAIYLAVLGLACLVLRLYNFF